MDVAKNFAKGTLTQGYDDEATSIVLVAGDGVRFPSVPFNATWWNSTDFPDPSDDPNREIVRVTAISTDTLTITRAQENTPALEHQLEGKVYKLIAGLTAKVINDEMLPVTRVSTNYEIDVAGSLAIDTGESFTVSAAGAGGLRLNANAIGVVLDMSGTAAALGDVDENNSGVALIADDNLGQVSVRGKFGTNQNASASGPVGTVVAKLPIHNLAGTLVGYIPIYDSIT
jgi:hypothetical protein